MQGKLKSFATDYEAAQEKALIEEQNAKQLCPRVAVTKYCARFSFNLYLT